MIICMNQKMTANQVAKWIVYDKGQCGTEFWDEDCSIEQNLLTDKEKQDIGAAMDRQVNRVKSFLNINKIWRMMK